MSWSDVIKGALSQVKDSTASIAIEKWLAKELSDYGELLEFHLNISKRSVDVRVLLSGDHEPISVHVEGYELVQRGTEDFIVVKQAHASRPWVQAVLRNFIINKPHKIPQQYGQMARMVLGS